MPFSLKNEPKATYVLIEDLCEYALIIHKEGRTATKTNLVIQIPC